MLNPISNQNHAHTYSSFEENASEQEVKLSSHASTDIKANQTKTNSVSSKIAGFIKENKVVLLAGTAVSAALVAGLYILRNRQSLGNCSIYDPKVENKNVFSIFKEVVGKDSEAKTQICVNGTLQTILFESKYGMQAKDNKWVAEGFFENGEVTFGVVYKPSSAIDSKGQITSVRNSTVAVIQIQDELKEICDEFDKKRSEKDSQNCQKRWLEILSEEKIDSQSNKEVNNKDDNKPKVDGTQKEEVE